MISSLGIWHKAKAQKEVAFLWSVIHKAMVVNEWHGKISTLIDKCCPHCSPQSVESVEDRFFSCPLSQQGWQYATKIMWQLFAKKEPWSEEIIFYDAMPFFISLCARH